MNFSLFPLIMFVVGLLLAKKARKNFYQTVYRPQKKSKRVQLTAQEGLIQNYSKKNKECYEHEAKVSVLDEKPKRKKSLWNEPSWDDELYS